VPAGRAAEIFIIFVRLALVPMRPFAMQIELGLDVECALRSERLVSEYKYGERKICENNSV